jgi:hypothetical protein
MPSEFASPRDATVAELLAALEQAVSETEAEAQRFLGQGYGLPAPPWLAVARAAIAKATQAADTRGEA